MTRMNTFVRVVRVCSQSSSKRSGSRAPNFIFKRSLTLSHPQLRYTNLQRSFHATTSSHAESNPDSETSQEVEDVFQKILALDVIEAHLLQNLINEKLGITVTERDLRGGGGGKGGKPGGAAHDAAQAEEEKTAFDLKLTGFDAKSKIKVIKEVRTITGLGLKEAKEIVEGAPKVIKKEIKKEEAEEIKAKLEAVGATVEIE